MNSSMSGNLKLIRFVQCLIFVMSGFASVVAAAPDYGNLTAVEYGDAVYKRYSLLDTFPLLVLTGGNYQYNHVGIYSGINNVTQQFQVVQAMKPGEVTQEVPFVDIFGAPATYYGAYTLDNRTLTFYERKAVVETGLSLVAANIVYPDEVSWPFIDAIDYYGGSFDGSVNDIWAIRCDGFSEYTYEKWFKDLAKYRLSRC